MEFCNRSFGPGYLEPRGAVDHWPCIDPYRSPYQGLYGPPYGGPNWLHMMLLWLMSLPAPDPLAGQGCSGASRGPRRWGWYTRPEHLGNRIWGRCMKYTHLENRQCTLHFLINFRVHMGPEHASREKKLTMVIFLIFVQKNVSTIRFQEIKIRPLKAFEKMHF